MAAKRQLHVFECLAQHVSCPVACPTILLSRNARSFRRWATGPRHSDAPVYAGKFLESSGFSRALPVREEQMAPAAAIEFLPGVLRLGEAVGDGEDDRRVMT